MQYAATRASGCYTELHEYRLPVSRNPSDPPCRGSKNRLQSIHENVICVVSFLEKTAGVRLPRGKLTAVIRFDPIELGISWQNWHSWRAYLFQLGRIYIKVERINWTSQLRSQLISRQLNCTTRNSNWRIAATASTTFARWRLFINLNSSLYKIILTDLTRFICNEI